MERYTVEDAARLIGRFSPENPLIVPPAMYARLEEMPRLADLMQNVRPNLPIPLTPAQGMEIDDVATD